MIIESDSDFVFIEVGKEGCFYILLIKFIKYENCIVFKGEVIEVREDKVYLLWFSKTYYK